MTRTITTALLAAAILFAGDALAMTNSDADALADYFVQFFAIVAFD